MKRNVHILTVLVLFIIGFSYVQAQPRKNFNFGKDRIADLLKLSDDQQEKFTQLHFDHKEKVIELQANIMQNRLKIQKLLLSNDFNQNKLLDLTKANDNLRSQIHESRTQTWLNIYNMLDDTQKEIWKDHIASSFENDTPRKHGMQRFGSMHGCRMGNLDRANRSFLKHFPNNW